MSADEQFLLRLSISLEKESMSLILTFVPSKMQRKLTEILP